MFEQFRKFLAYNPTVMSAFHFGLPSSSTSGIPSSLRILDSGASHHMSPYFPSFAFLLPGSHVSIMYVIVTPMPIKVLVRLLPIIYLSLLPICNICFQDWINIGHKGVKGMIFGKMHV